jgi:hypothetical protein
MAHLRVRHLERFRVAIDFDGGMKLFSLAVQNMKASFNELGSTGKCITSLSAFPLML